MNLLRKHNAAFFIYELDGHVTPFHVTSQLVYVRLHGPQGKYGAYTEEVMHECLAWQQAGLGMYVYFDNDQLGYAVSNALRLQKLVAR